MTAVNTHSNAASRSIWKSVGAVLFGLAFIFVTSLGTDQLFHSLNVYPPWGQPMYETRLNLLALSYRIVYGILGSFITAKFAPHSAMRHALILGGIGFVLSTLGAITAISLADLGPIWYPVLLVFTALPCAWLGGLLYQRQQQ